MKILNIEWKHFDKEGKTCERCSETGNNLREVINDLQQGLSAQGIWVELKEIRLPENQMPESNQILFNGVSLEELIPKAIAGENNCYSCSQLINNAAGCRCRTVNFQGRVFEEIPKELIELAALKALGLK